MLDLLLEVDQRLLLHMNGLSHHIGSIGLLRDALGDELFGLRIAGLVLRLPEPVKNAGDYVAFLRRHRLSPLVSMRRPLKRRRTACGAGPSGLQDPASERREPSLNNKKSPGLRPGRKVVP